MNSAWDKVMGIFFIFASLLIPVMMILINKETLLDYSTGFTMGAMFVAGIMMCA
jgi:hypothetical protein